MKTVDLRWTPFRTLLRRENARFFKVIVQTIVTPLVNGSLYLLIFGVSLGQSITLEMNVSYLAFLIPGLVMMGCMNNAFQNTSSSLVSAKFQGELEDLKVAPLSASQIVWAMSLSALYRGLLVGLITFIVGEVFYFFSFGELLKIHHFLPLMIFLCWGGLIFANFGLAVGFWAKTFDQMSAISGFILTPLMYLGGVFFSVQGLHPIWQKIAMFNPMLYLINGVRYGMLGVSDVNPWTAFAIASVALVMTHAVALYTLKVGSFQRW